MADNLLPLRDAVPSSPTRAAKPSSRETSGGIGHQYQERGTSRPVMRVGLVVEVVQTDTVVREWLPPRNDLKLPNVPAGMSGSLSTAAARESRGGVGGLTGSEWRDPRGAEKVTVLLR